jgi:peptidyl-prolyl cis-trans isomerase D
MIQWMSRLSKSWAASLLMGGLALSFVVWGIADVFTGVSTGAVATVGGVEISPQEFQRSYRNFLRNEGQQMGAPISPDLADKMGLPTVALQQMVSRTALDNVAADLGLTTSDAEVAKYVRAQDSFRGVGGFDHATFLRLVQGAGYSEQDFLKEVRADLTRGQLTGAVESNFTLPAGYATALFQFLNERRAVRYVIVAPAAVGPVAAPPDAALSAYVKAHAAKYSTPEYRDVTFAHAGPDDVAAQTVPTDAAVQQYYNDHKADYVVPEKRELQQIEFPSEAEAKAARAQLNGGQGFEALAAARKLKPSDISLGTLAQNELPDPARAKAAFALGEGEVSQPVKGAFGWVLVRAVKIVPGSSRSLDDVKADIKKTLSVQLAAGKLVDMANAFQDARGGGGALDAAAQKAGMKVDHVVLDAQGLAPTGETAAAPADPEFRAQVFAAEVGEDSDAFATKIGTYYAIRVNGVTPPKLKTLDQVRAQALEDWTAEQRAKLVAAKAAELAQAARQAGNLDGVAKTLHVTVQDSPGLARGTADTTFSQSLTQQVFAAPPGAILSGPQGSAGNYLIAQVSGISHPAPVSEQYRQGTAQLAATVAGDISIALANAGRADQRVRVNQKLVASVANGGS